MPPGKPETGKIATFSHLGGPRPILIAFWTRVLRTGPGSNDSEVFKPQARKLDPIKQKKTKPKKRPGKRGSRSHFFFFFFLVVLALPGTVPVGRVIEAETVRFDVFISMKMKNVRSSPPRKLNSRTAVAVPGRVPRERRRSFIKSRPAPVTIDGLFASRAVPISTWSSQSTADQI